MRTFKRWLLGICIVGFAVLILSLAHLGQPTPPLQVSPSTTVITEPLTDDNLPDYAAYHLNQLRGDITPAENAALPLLQALWPGEIRPRSREALCAELGMEIPDRQGLKEKGFWPGSAASVVRDIMVHQPWTAEEFPLVAEWIEAQHDTFRLLHEAAGKPKFYFPSPTLLLEPKSPFLAMEVPHLPLLQTGVEALAVRSMYALGRGDIEAAWEDARAIYRLSELVPHDTTVSAVFTIAYDNVAHQVTLRILESPQLSTSLAEEVCAYLAERRPRFSAQRALELERLSLASTLVYYSSQPGSRLDELLASRFPSEEVGAALATVPMDWNVVLRRSNAWYDQAVQAVSDADLSGRTHRIREIEREIERARPTTTDIALGVISREMRSRQMADLMMRQWLLSTLSTVALHEFRERASLGLMQVATHLAVYRAAHGAYPSRSTSWKTRANCFPEM